MDLTEFQWRTLTEPGLDASTLREQLRTLLAHGRKLALLHACEDCVHEGVVVERVRAQLHVLRGLGVTTHGLTIDPCLSRNVAQPLPRQDAAKHVFHFHHGYLPIGHSGLLRGAWSAATKATVSQLGRLSPSPPDLRSRVVP